MSDTVAELAKQGCELNVVDRERLIEMLLDSFHDAPDPRVEEAWRVEIKRRIDAYERGDAVLHDVDEVMAEAKSIAP